MDPQTRDQAGCSMAAEALRSWGTLKLRATGISMLPALWPGDLLTVSGSVYCRELFNCLQGAVWVGAVYIREGPDFR